MNETKLNDRQLPPAAACRELDERELQSVEGGRDVNDGSYLYYFYYDPNQELKPFTK